MPSRSGWHPEADYAANQAMSTLFASRWTMYLWNVLTIGVWHNVQKSADANTVGIAFLQASYGPKMRGFQMKSLQGSSESICFRPWLQRTKKTVCQNDEKKDELFVKENRIYAENPAKVETLAGLVDLKRLELSTSRMRTERSPS